MKLNTIKFSSRLQQALKQSPCKTMKDLAKFSNGDIIRWPNIGQTTLFELRYIEDLYNSNKKDLIPMIHCDNASSVNLILQNQTLRKKLCRVKIENEKLKEKLDDVEGKLRFYKVDLKKKDKFERLTRKQIKLIDEFKDQLLELVKSII